MRKASHGSRGSHYFRFQKKTHRPDQEIIKHIIKFITINKMKAVYIKNRDIHIRAESTAQQDICLYRQTIFF